MVLLSLLLDVNQADKMQETEFKQHTCAGKQTFPQPGMQKFVHERFVQRLGACQQYLQASEQTNKQTHFCCVSSLARAVATPAINTCPSMHLINPTYYKTIIGNFFVTYVPPTHSTCVRPSSRRCRQRHASAAASVECVRVQSYVRCLNYIC